jgi:hypothetical protein
VSSILAGWTVSLVSAALGGSALAGFDASCAKSVAGVVNRTAKAARTRDERNIGCSSKLGRQESNRFETRRDLHRYRRGKIHQCQGIEAYNLPPEQFWKIWDAAKKKTN